MTLSEALLNYRTRHHLSTKSLGYRIGLSVPTILKIEKTNCYSQAVAKKITDTLGSDFEQFVTYSICVVCGEPFYARGEQQATCSHECSYYLGRHKNGNKIHEYPVNQNKKLENEYFRKKKIVKQINSIAEFNQEARNQGKSYGEWQSAKLINSEVT